MFAYRRVIFGAVANDNVKLLKEINKTELATLLPLVFLTILLGVFPNIILDTISVSVENVISVYNEKLLILKQASIK